ncbi:hypothetical protein M9Y10_034881 [Tritrichomonas musculus]|uniref:Uncharacterized protein n=1 Tax=Tritrichomonas musculus TaxID=1915356 RepID=A0ABR2KH93_9EUKA
MTNPEAKHLLQNPWTFYYLQKSNNTQNYSDQIKKIAKVDSVEDFWAVYSHTISPQRLKPSLQLHFFRNDSRAMWEDEDNKRGGAFLVTVPQSHASEQWEKLLLALIGDQIDKDFIGAVINIRPDCHRIFVWNQTADIEKCRQLSKDLFDVLELPYKTKICYNPHSKFLSTDGTGKMVSSTTYQLEADGPVILQGNGK